MMSLYKISTETAGENNDAKRGKKTEEITSFKKLSNILFLQYVDCNPARYFLYHVTVFCKEPVLQHQNLIG